MTKGSHDLPSRRPTPSETQAFLQLIQRKPPAKIDGLLHFVADMRHDRYTSDEQRLMRETQSGRLLARALTKCEGLKEKAREESSSALKTQNVKSIQGAEESILKYLDCLAFMTCRDRWIQYTQCWTNLSSLPLAQPKGMHSTGGFEMLCQKERHALERCVGNLVSETVRASASGEADRELEDFNDHEQ